MTRQGFYRELFCLLEIGRALVVKDRSIPAINEWTYRMANRVIETIMKDPNFRESLMEA